jgi:glycosyltransferase involved in cell wall biosynthesis
MTRDVIVEVVQELTPGGIQVMVLELCRRLTPEFDVHVVSLEGTSDDLRSSWSRAATLGARLHGLNKAPGRDVKLALRLMQLLRRLQPFAVHTHHIGPLLYGGLAARLAGVRALVHTEHDTWHLSSARRRRLQLSALALLRPRLVASAQAVAAGLMQSIPTSRPRIIPNGIDTVQFSPADRAEARRTLGLPLTMQIVGTAGRLDPVKGHDLLIRALAELPRHVLLAIAGDGSSRPVLEELARSLKVHERTMFLGQIDDTATFYRSLDVFCLPSRCEGLPLVLLEAQACCVPVVATDVGAVREALGGNATCLVRPDDVEGLAGGIRQALQTRTDVNSRPFIVEQYDARQMARAYRGLLTA